MNDQEIRQRYDGPLANEIELRWQDVWKQRDVFCQPNPGEEGFDASRPKFFCLDMFPYPSGAGLHVGHPEGYTATDILCRYKKMRGFNVLHPMGWDAFGLPAEQYAIQTGVHPAQTTRKSIDNFRRQLQRFGFCYDWKREFGTIDEEYYRWTQWIFLRIYGSWYDPDAKRARPIEELEREFIEGAREVRYNPNAAEYSGAGELPQGATAGGWEGLDLETRRTILDSYRLAYVANQTVNWCPKLGTALANEEVIDGRSERGGFPVLRKPLRQWLFRITSYADRLLAGLGDVDWPASTKAMQSQWIGRSEGAEIDFQLDNSPVMVKPALRVFTTRPDTIFGATYMVVAPEHPLVQAILEEPPVGWDVAPLRDYAEGASNRTDIERQEAKEKTGVFTGVMATNPATGKPIPVWTSDYVLMGYGTGAIMAVPGQDERDWEFAEAFGLAIVRTVQPPADFEGTAYTGEGPSINSGFLDGLAVEQAKARMIAWLREQACGVGKVNYRLRDWLFSRQRYWGEPFPIVYDQRGWPYGVSEDSLPVSLPPLADYVPEESDEPKPLLAKAQDWVRTTAGEAGVLELPADRMMTRETNTMPGWAGSCWYFLRFCDPKNNERFVGREAEAYWMDGGVDLYIGGAEHAVLHLLYARFWHKVLYDLGEVSTDEPFAKLFHQGLITSFSFQRPDKTLVAADQAHRLICENPEDLPEPDWSEIPQKLPVPSQCRIEPVVPSAWPHYTPKTSGSSEMHPGVVELLRQQDGSYYFETGQVSQLLVEQLTGKKEWRHHITAKMSKSLKNVVNPDDVIAEYGADTFRLYEMYMGPLEASKPWNTRDISGLMRFLQRVWRMLLDEDSGEPILADDADEALEKKLHRTIAKVGGDIERLAFNTAIAAMIEFVNAATGAREKTGTRLTRDQALRFAQVLAPFAPHVGEELWSRLGGSGLVCQAYWPEYDEAMLTDDQIEIPVQIMGKLRARIMAPADADQKTLEALALADENIKRLIEGKPVRKVIVVPGRLVNIVAG